MILRELTLTNFKNIGGASLEFSPKINCLLGDNGMGKSNLLDAIHFLSFCKSFNGLTDPMLMKRGEDFAMLRGRYTRHGVEEEITAGLTAGRRKSFRRGGKEYQRLSDHIGLFPLVMVAPADSGLITGGSELRRRFVDMLVSQSDRRYLEALMTYNRALTQRNSMLRDHIGDTTLYLALEMQMDGAAAYIYRARRELVRSLSEIFGRYYGAIAGSGEQPGLAYVSQMDETDGSLEALLETRRERDRVLGYTSAGPHRDDIDMTLDGMPARQTASQGQSKTYTIALRLAQYEFLKNSAGMSPLLLLDDIFDKLDAGRVERIMGIVASDTFGQIFVTDTNRRHLDEVVAVISGPHRLWNVADGVFTPINTI